MRLGRHDDLIVGSSAFRISTDLLSADIPTVETRVSYKNRTIFRTATEHPSLRPIFKNSQQVSKTIEAQHQSIMEQLKQGRISLDKESPHQDITPDERLSRALRLMDEGDLAGAERDLSIILEQSLEIREARGLLDAVKAARTGAPTGDPLPSFKLGAEAFAAGKKGPAIESWKRCLATEPSNRKYQLAVLLATSGTAVRRKRWVQEILALGSKLLADGHSKDAYSLLLIAQSAEQTSPLDAASETAAPSVPLEPGSVSAKPPPPLGSPEATSPEILRPRIWPKPMTEPPSRPSFTQEPPKPPVAAAQPPRRPAPASQPKENFSQPEPISAEELEQTLPDEDMADVLVIDDPLESETPWLPPAVPTSTPSQLAMPELAKEPGSPSPPTPGSIREATKAKEESEAESSLFDVEDEREAALFEAWEAEVVAGRAQKSGREGERAGRALGRSPASRWEDLKDLRKLLPKILYAGAGILLLALILTTVVFFGRDKVPPEVLEQAAAYLDAGQYERAAGAYSAILTSYGDYAPAFLGRGRAHLASQNLEEGLADLTRALELDPESASIAEELADVLFTDGRFQEAVSNYRKAQASGEISPQAHYRLASSLAQLGQTDEALPELRSALEKDASHEEARLFYANLLNSKARYAEAEQALRSARTRIDAKYYYDELGMALLEQGKLDDAEEVARTYLSEQPETAGPYALLGDIYLRRKQYEPARRELIRALRIDPEEPRAQIALGRAWLAIGEARNDRQDLAKARLVLAYAKGVREGERLLVLGQVSSAEGNTPDAIHLLEQALSKGANPLEARLALARAKYAAKDLAGVAEELQQAAAFAPPDPALSLSLGLVYSLLDDPRRAAEQYLTAIQGVGLTAPPDEENGPVVLPQPYIPLPQPFDLTRTIRSAYRQTLSASGEEDPTATALKALAETTSFVLAGTN